jgi:hypothetical protein
VQSIVKDVAYNFLSRHCQLFWFYLKHQRPCRDQRFSGKIRRVRIKYRLRHKAFLDTIDTLISRSAVRRWNIQIVDILQGQFNNPSLILASSKFLHQRPISTWPNFPCFSLLCSRILFSQPFKPTPLLHNCLTIYLSSMLRISLPRTHILLPNATYCCEVSSTGLKFRSRTSWKITMLFF